MNAIVKSVPVISALVLSNAAFAQSTPVGRPPLVINAPSGQGTPIGTPIGRPPLVINAPSGQGTPIGTPVGRPPLTISPFDLNGDGVLNARERRRRDELTGRALILRVYDLNGDGVVDPTTERLNFSQVTRTLRTLSLEDFPQLPILGVPSEFQRFDLNGDNFISSSERSNARTIISNENRRANRREIRQVAAQFNVTRQQVRQVRRTLRGDASREAQIAANLVPVREELRQRRNARVAEREALRVSRFQQADFDGNGTLDFSEFLTLPETVGALSFRPNRLERTLRTLLSAYVRRDVNSSLELDLNEFTLNTGDFLGN